MLKLKLTGNSFVRIKEKQTLVCPKYLRIARSGDEINVTLRTNPSEKTSVRMIRLPEQRDDDERDVVANDDSDTDDDEDCSGCTLTLGKDEKISYISLSGDSSMVCACATSLAPVTSIYLADKCFIRFLQPHKFNTLDIMMEGSSVFRGNWNVVCDQVIVLLTENAEADGIYYMKNKNTEVRDNAYMNILSKLKKK